MSYTPHPLTYPTDALEPHIDRQTMEIHHSRHYATYVANLNKALEGAPALVAPPPGEPSQFIKNKVPEAASLLKANSARTSATNQALLDAPRLGERPLNELLIDHCAVVPEPIRTAVRNNGGGAYNHALFWRSLSPNGGGVPRGALAGAIDDTFGSFEQFRERFAVSATSRFGSGWAWLVCRDGRLEVCSTPNQDSPVMEGANPILGLDVWEHAYYLHYQNRRADYVAAFWNIVNWDYASERFETGHENLF